MTAFSPKPRRRSRRCCNAEIRGAEYTLTGPLPPTISYQDLQMARADVLSYLEFLTRDLAQGDPERAVTEIQRAADRLKTIARWTPNRTSAGRVGSGFGSGHVACSRVHVSFLSLVRGVYYGEVC